MSELAYRAAYDLRNSQPCTIESCGNVRVAGRSRCVDHLMTCAVTCCPNPRLLKQAARYCAFHSDLAQRRDSNRRHVGRDYLCELCHRQFNGGTHSSNPNMPIFCVSCATKYKPFAKRWVQHGVSRSTIIEWLRAPVCYWCHESINLEAFSSSKSVNLDHNHNCCPGAFGCGKCYRGLVHPRCNLVIGVIEKAVDIMGPMQFSLRVYQLLST